MNGRRAFLCIAFGALGAVGCRQILDISEYDFDAGPDATIPVTDSGADGNVGTDGGPSTDAGNDGSTPPPQDAAAQIKACGDKGSGTGTPDDDCIHCCRTSFGNDIQVYSADALDAGCLCAGSNDCTAVCTIDGGTCPPNGMPGPDCGRCVDKNLIQTCVGTKAETACQNDPKCANGMACLKACPPPQ